MRRRPCPNFHFCAFSFVFQIILRTYWTILLHLDIKHYRTWAFSNFFFLKSPRCAGGPAQIFISVHFHLCSKSFYWLTEQSYCTWTFSPCLVDFPQPESMSLEPRNILYIATYQLRSFINASSISNLVENVAVHN